MKSLSKMLLIIGLFITMDVHASNNSNYSSENDLPIELWGISFRSLPRNDLLEKRRVSRAWKQQADEVICEYGIKLSTEHDWISIPKFLNGLSILTINLNHQYPFAPLSKQHQKLMNRLTALTKLNIDSKQRVIPDLSDLDSAKLSSLTSLQLTSENFEDNDFNRIRELTNLKKIVIKTQNFEAYSNQNLQDLTKLEKLAIETENKTACLSSHLVNLINLTSFEFKTNSFQPDDFEQVIKLTNLENLTIIMKTQAAHLTDGISHLTKLKSLTINSGLLAFANLGSATRSESSLSDLSPVSSIGALKELTELDLGNDFYKQYNPDFLTSLSNLTKLSFNCRMLIDRNSQGCILELAKYINLMTKIRELHIRGIHRLKPEQQQYVKELFQPKFNRIAETKKAMHFYK